jgi:hypothetical protein
LLAKWETDLLRSGQIKKAPGGDLGLRKNQSIGLMITGKTSKCFFQLSTEIKPSIQLVFFFLPGGGNMLFQRGNPRTERLNGSLNESKEREISNRSESKRSLYKTPTRPGVFQDETNIILRFINNYRYLILNNITKPYKLNLLKSLKCIKILHFSRFETLARRFFLSVLEVKNLQIGGLKNGSH